ncbi:hypothetical protein C0991_000127 [Blastosporella zonata]|nr:hypothetical protein C0991_000127 [Blastosporella zonata]
MDFIPNSYTDLHSYPEFQYPPSDSPYYLITDDPPYYPMPQHMAPPQVPLHSLSPFLVYPPEVPLNHIQLSLPSISAAPCEPSKSFSHPEPTATRLAPATFPTPSAMLSELAATTRPHSEPKNETVRKARRRAMAQSIGFVPTDPCAPTPGPDSIPKSPLTEPTRDAISSHEKKRHYLECLEYYVTYLHQQLSLVGCVPVRLQRPTSSGRGMTSQSIRTLLVHMENLTRRLNQEMLAEEQRVSTA